MPAEPVDVLVIGAGVAGAVVGKRLADAGLTVVCLEQGEWPDRTEYPGASPEWELRAAKQWSSDPAVRKGTADYPIDLTDSDYGALNFNGVGGGSVLYNAQWPRMLPDDFRARSVDGVADDWPLRYADLEPYYEATDRDFGVSGLGGNPMYPPGTDPPLGPLPIGEVGMLVARAHARLGWHWWPGTNAILSGPYAGRNPCVRRGSCGSGCNEGAKASTDLTHWPDVVRRGGRVVTGARVERIVVDRRGLACGAEYADGTGVRRYQPAQVVVCAANGIGTPRLLLASACALHPDGLANSSGLVGRNLMLHRWRRCRAYLTAPLAAGARIPACSSTRSSTRAATRREASHAGRRGPSRRRAARYALRSPAATAGGDRTTRTCASASGGPAAGSSSRRTCPTPITGSRSRRR